MNGSVSGIAFLNFEVASHVCALSLLFDWKRMSLNMLRPLNHPQNVSAVKAGSEQ